MRRLCSFAFLSLLVLPLSCGEPTDREQDCTADEYFDANEQLCLSCPSLGFSQCRIGCGFSITPDAETGCPPVLCRDPSDCACQEPERLGQQIFSEETLTCELIPCAEGSFYDASRNSCQTCPDRDASTSGPVDLSLCHCYPLEFRFSTETQTCTST